MRTRYNVGLLIAAFFLSGCSERKPLHNYQPGVSARVYINTHECHDLAGGWYECNHVRFNPQEVKAK